MLTRLQVNGFKNLVDVDVRFGPFTWIAVANGTGKSNQFDAIRFLSGLAGGSLLEAALAVRDDSGKNADLRSIFQRIGNEWKNRITFAAEMIVSPNAIDELGQPAKATTSFSRYELVIGLRETSKTGSNAKVDWVTKTATMDIWLDNARTKRSFGVGAGGMVSSPNEKERRIRRWVNGGTGRKTLIGRTE